MDWTMHAEVDYHPMLTKPLRASVGHTGAAEHMVFSLKLCLTLNVLCRWSGVREWLFLQWTQAEVWLCHREGGSLHQQLSGAPHGWERWEKWWKTLWRWRTRQSLRRVFAFWDLSEMAAWLAENGPVSVALNAFAMQVSGTYTATFHTSPWPS